MSSETLDESAGWLVISQAAVLGVASPQWQLADTAVVFTEFVSARARRGAGRRKFQTSMRDAAEGRNHGRGGRVGA